MNVSAFKNLKKTFQHLSIIIDGLDTDNNALIDFDLSLEKTRILYEQLSELKLRKLSQKTSITEQKSGIFVTKKAEGEPTKPVSEERISDDIDLEAEHLLNEKERIEFVPETKTNEQATKKIIETEEEIIEELVVAVETPSGKDTETKHEVTESTPVTPKEDTIADQFENKTSLNDILAKIASDDDLATQLQKSPITNLKNAISLNDKIWFTRELFDGNNENYLSALERINASEDIKKAIQVVDTFEWDMKERSTKRFLELIYRRFV